MLSEVIPNYYEAFLAAAPSNARHIYTMEQCIEDWKCGALLWWFAYVPLLIGAYEANNATVMTFFESALRRWYTGALRVGIIDFAKELYER